MFSSLSGYREFAFFGLEKTNTDLVDADLTLLKRGLQVKQRLLWLVSLRSSWRFFPCNVMLNLRREVYFFLRITRRAIIAATIAPATITR
jgi:hypothetical protein